MSKEQIRDKIIVCIGSKVRNQVWIQVWDRALNSTWNQVNVQYFDQSFEYDQICNQIYSNTSRRFKNEQKAN